MKLLFVCMGNICRSPAAEAVMRAKVEERGLTHQISCDSAGTIGYHAGQPSDARMRAAAQRRGYEMNGRARQIQSDDLETFDWVITMDDDNLRDVIALDSSKTHQDKIRPLGEFFTESEDTEVPDPYYGGNDGFEHVLDLLEDGCEHLLDHLESRGLKD